MGVEVWWRRRGGAALPGPSFPGWLSPHPDREGTPDGVEGAPLDRKAPALAAPGEGWTDGGVGLRLGVHRLRAWIVVSRGTGRWGSRAALFLGRVDPALGQLRRASPSSRQRGVVAGRVRGARLWLVRRRVRAPGVPGGGPADGVPRGTGRAQPQRPRLGTQRARAPGDSSMASVAAVLPRRVGRLIWRSGGTPGDARGR